MDPLLPALLAPVGGPHCRVRPEVFTTTQSWRVIVGEQMADAGTTMAEHPGDSDDLAAMARYEREVAALDLSDAEQADCRAIPQRELAAELYASADIHRLRAEGLEATYRHATR